MPQAGRDIKCSAVILSGGLNSRMGGQNKAFLDVGGKSILDRALETLTPIFAEILIVTRQPDLYRHTRLTVVRDIFHDRSSLTGIHAGLYHSSAAHVFVVPCDAPFLKPGLVHALLDEFDPSLDVIVPVHRNRYQPLCAIYSKRCLGPIEDQLRNKDFKIINFFDRVATKTLPAQMLEKIDPGLNSFFNVNTPDAYQTSKQIAQFDPKDRT